MHDAFVLQEYGIRGFPTIKVFVPGKPPVDYQGARDVKPIVEFALSQVCCSLPYLIYIKMICCFYFYCSCSICHSTSVYNYKSFSEDVKCFLDFHRPNLFRLQLSAEC